MAKKAAKNVNPMQCRNVRYVAHGGGQLPATVSGALLPGRKGLRQGCPAAGLIDVRIRGAWIF
jgi:hypothetical protein